MSLKRKRSLSNSSPLSASSTTTTTSRSSQSPTPIPHASNKFTDISTPYPSSPISSWTTRIGLSSTDLNSRTRKRYRDNRPDEETIHEATIDKLFTAQRQHPHASPIPSHSAPGPPPTAPVQKSTLHSFWQLPAPPSQPAVLQTPSMATSNANSPRCEDCDAVLRQDDEMMDVDFESAGEGQGEFACLNCARGVCDLCAVVGDARHCLQCATGSSRRGW